MATDRQMLANRLNAARSTGPTSAEGKATSRGNALKHGLAARKLLPRQDAAAAADRAEQWNSSLKPNNPWELWLVERIAVESLRVDRCTREESALRGRLALRAEACWDDDRRAEVGQLARGLARDPASTRAKLEATWHGCDWLVARWGELLGVLDGGGTWDELQAGRARDLLGATIGEGETPEELAGWGRADVERLGLKRDLVLSLIDTTDRAIAESGMGPDPEGAIRRVRRYETACLRRLEWAWSQLKKGRREAPAAGPDPDPRGGPPGEPLAEVGEMDPGELRDAERELSPAEWAFVEEMLTNPAAVEAAKPAAGRPGMAAAAGGFTLAGSLREQVRGPQQGGNRRRRRASRKG